MLIGLKLTEGYSGLSLGKNIINHKKICNSVNFIIDQDEIYCEKCSRVLLKFCPFCGSTRLGDFISYHKCNACKSVFDKEFL